MSSSQGVSLELLAQKNQEIEKLRKQQQLILDIVSRLDNGAVTGEWPREQCRYCCGESSGYSDSQSFDHAEDCIVPLVRQLRETTWSE